MQPKKLNSYESQVKKENEMWSMVGKKDIDGMVDYFEGDDTPSDNNSNTSSGKKSPNYTRKSTLHKKKAVYQPKHNKPAMI